MSAITEAFELMQRGDLAAAETKIAAILERTPEDADALHVMAGVHHAKGDLPGAASYFERAHQVSPYDAEIAFNRAVILSMLGRRAETVEACAAFLKLRPGDPEALLMQGVALAALGQHEAALAAFDQTYEHRADVHARRAASLLALHRTEDALTAAARASGIDPNNPDAHYHRGAAFVRLELWPEAIEAFDLALRLAPNNVAIRAARAPALARLSRFDEALADIDAALARVPDRAEYQARRTEILAARAAHKP
jgi:tetratricopeptide (TPR) repeat protein